MEHRHTGLYFTVCTYSAVFPESESFHTARGRGKPFTNYSIVYRSGNGKQALAHSDISALPDSLLAEVGFNQLFSIWNGGIISGPKNKIETRRATQTHRTKTHTSKCSRAVTPVIHTHIRTTDTCISYQRKVLHKNGESYYLILAAKCSLTRCLTNQSLLIHCHAYQECI